MRRLISRWLNRSKQAGDTIDLEHLTRLARRYTVEQQQVPKNLIDLVSRNYLGKIPVAPQGQRFVIDRRSVRVRLE